MHKKETRRLQTSQTKHKDDLKAKKKEHPERAGDKRDSLRKLLFNESIKYVLGSAVIEDVRSD